MSNKVDKLFKDKLESHSLQPSAQAWEKVEAHLGKKNKMVLWLRVAAAIALLGVLTFVGLNWSGVEQKQELVKKETGVGSQETGDRSQESGDRSQESVAGKKIEKEEIKKETPKKAIETIKEKSVEPVLPVTEESSEPRIAVVTEPATDTETPAPTIQNPETTKGIKLTYELPTRQKEKSTTVTYSLPTIRKGEPTETMIAEEQKKKGFERVLEIAREVKNGDPLGELREAKDDILALDFRKDKNKKH